MQRAHLRREQQSDARKADHHARDFTRRRRPAARPQPVEQNDPHWFAGDQQSGHSGRNPLFGDGHRAVTAEKQQEAQHDRGAPVDQFRPHARPEQTDREQDGPSHQKPAPGHQQWRNRLDCIPDSQVRGAPDDVDNGESQQEPPPRGTNFSHGAPCPARPGLEPWPAP